MFKSVGTLMIILALGLGATPAASAHERSYDRYHAPRHQHTIVYRERYMPQRLERDRGFRLWYHRSSLRHNYYLAWWQLFEIYRWERRYDIRHDHAVHYGSRHHDYDWYRHYWLERDRHRHRHERRGHSGRDRHDAPKRHARRDVRRGQRDDD